MEITFAGIVRHIYASEVRPQTNKKRWEPQISPITQILYHKAFNVTTGGNDTTRGKLFPFGLVITPVDRLKVDISSDLFGLG